MDGESFPVLVQIGDHWVNIRSIVAVRHNEAAVPGGASTMIYVPGWSFRIDLPLEQVLDRVYDVARQLSSEDWSPASVLTAPAQDWSDT